MMLYKKFQVTKGHITKYSLSPIWRLHGSEIVENRCFMVKATTEVLIYGFNKENTSADSFVLIPNDALGTDYIIPSWANVKSLGFNWKSQFGIVSLFENNQIEILLPKRNPPLNVTLNVGIPNQYRRLQLALKKKYDALQIQSYQDLTGTRIRSDKSIGVISGNSRTSIKGKPTYTLPGDNKIHYISSDHIEEMIPPVSTWGCKFIAVPQAERTSGDVIRILASKNGTVGSVINTRNLSYFEINEGDFHEVDVESDDNLAIIANYPIMVVQYSKTGNVDRVDSDPFMVVIPPIEQFDTVYTFSTINGTTNKYRNFISVVIKKEEVLGLYIDGHPLFNSDPFNNIIKGVAIRSVTLENVTYAAFSHSIAEGTYTISHLNPTVQFSVIVYGQNNYESYGHPAGMRLAPLYDSCVKSTTQQGDGIDNDCDGRIDEERLDGIDQDGDGLIDEDIAPYPIFTTNIPSTIDSSTVGIVDMTTSLPDKSIHTSRHPVDSKHTSDGKSTNIRPSLRPTTNIPSTTTCKISSEECSCSNLTASITRHESEFKAQRQLNQYLLQELNKLKSNTGAGPKECPDDFVYNPLDKSCYLFITIYRTWYQARQICQAHQADLASIESEEEHTFLVGHIVSNLNLRRKNFFLSGTDVKEDGHWIWTSTHQPFTFSKWHNDGQRTGHNEECVYMWSKAQYDWADISCNKVAGAICEVNKNVNKLIIG